MPSNFNPMNIFGQGQQEMGPAMTRRQQELQDFRNFKSNQVQTQVNADAASGGRSMKAFEEAKKVKKGTSLGKTGPLTQLTNSPLARFAGRALDIGGRLYGGYELLRPGATTRERVEGGGSIIAPLTPLAVGAMDAMQGVLSSDRGKAFTQAMTAGHGNQALRHLFGNYQRVPGLTPDVIDAKPDIGKLKELIVKNAQVLPKVQMKAEDEPVVSLTDKLQQERDTLGLTPMQQWAKAHPELANKVKEGQSGFQDIKALFDAEDTGIVGAEDTGRTPKDMLAINTTGLETLIGPDGIGESKPYKPESFRSEKMAGNRIFNLINPVK